MNSIRVLILFCFIYCASCFVIRFGPSDLEVGVLGDDDKLLTYMGSELYPVPGLNVTSVTIGVNSTYMLINFVRVKENAGNLEARAEIDRGGPGYDHVFIKLIPGPAQFFNYTTEVYGIELPSPEGYKRSMDKYEMTHYA